MVDIQLLMKLDICVILRVLTECILKIKKKKKVNKTKHPL